MNATKEYSLQWDASLKLNVDEIDEQHQHLIGLAERVFSISSPLEDIVVVINSIRELQSYIQTHFADEERLMVKHGYPLLEEHRVLHRRITFEVETMLHTTRDVMELVENMKKVMRKWVIQHILREDRKIAQFLHNLPNQ